MEICKTDIDKIVRYLDDAARLYNEMKGQRYVSRAWCIRRLSSKLKSKINSKK